MCVYSTCSTINRFWIVPSLIDNDIYFVFREIDQYKCLEIKVKIIKGKMKPNNKLNPEESNYIMKNVVKI